LLRKKAVRSPDAGPQQLVAFGLVVPERQLRVVPERNDALLSSLAPNLDLLRQEVDVHPVDSAQLRQTHPRRVEQLEDRAIPHVPKLSLLRLQLGRLKQQLDLRSIEVAGQILVLLRRRDAARRVRFHLFVQVQVLVKASHGRERAPDRALIELPPRHVREKAADGEPVETLPRPFANAVVVPEK